MNNFNDKNFNNEIGGYFSLETNPKYDNIKNNIALNSARNCLRYIVKTYKIKEIYLPFYTCSVVWQSLKKENCNLHFYHIDENFMPFEEFSKNDYILYTNYFGICAKNVKILEKKYKNLIVDNAHAFYMPACGLASFNSIRKFFGVPDGAILYSDKKLDIDIKKGTSYQRFSHLLKRIDENAKFGFPDFCNNENSLDDEDITTISNATKNIFNSIDIENVKQKRLENYKYLDKNLSDLNELKISLDKDDVPMVYPFMVKNENLRQKLYENNIYLARYWSETPEKYQEGMFQKYILPLPIDQRYNKFDMDKILSVIKN